MLKALVFVHTAEIAERLADADSWLAAEAQAISELLYETIGALPEPSGANRRESPRPALVGLRRSIYNVRLPAKQEWNSRAAQALPPRQRARVAAWVARWLQRRLDREQLLRSYEREADVLSAALRSAASSPEFRRGLLHASPTLTSELDRWLEKPTHRPDNQVLFRLAKYIARAASKTSPFSTFTYSGFATWEDRDTGPGVYLTPDPSLRGTTQLHDATRDSLVAGLSAESSLRPAMTVRVNPTIYITSETVFFLGPAPREQLLTIPMVPALRQLLLWLQSASPVTIGDILSSPMVGGDRAQFEAALAKLLEVGLLDLCPPSDTYLPTAGDLASWVANHGSTALQSVAGTLSKLDTLLREATPLGHLAAYRHTQHEIRTCLDELKSRLELSTPREPANGPATRDTVVADGGYLATCSRQRWRSVIHELDAMRLWMPILDYTLPLKLALAEWFRVQFDGGTRVSLHTFHRAVHEELIGRSQVGAALRSYWDPTWASPSNLLSSPFSGVRDLGQLREGLARHLARGPDDDGVIRVPFADMVDETRSWPEWAAPLPSLSCYLQPLELSDAAVVINVLDVGHGRGRSRIAHLLDPQAGRDSSDAGALSGPGAFVTAELTCLGGMYLNMRAPTAQYEIECAFSGAERPKHRRLRLAELEVVAAEDGRLELYSPRLDSFVRVAHTALVRTSLLTPVARLLATVFGDMALGRTSLLRDQRLSLRSEGGGAGFTVHRLSRLQVGQLVLRRARWMVAPTEFPRRAAGEREAEFFLRLTRFRRTHGMPRRCFVRRVSYEADPHPLRGAKRLKPMYVDFASPYLVRALDNALLAAHEALIVEEALPDPHELASTALPRVVELLVEVPTAMEANDVR